jgi:hypothetical protein
VARGRLVRAGGGRALRPHRLQPAARPDARGPRARRRRPSRARRPGPLPRQLAARARRLGRPAARLGPAGCDALAIRLASRSPREHAETWLRDDDAARWLDWYRDRGIEAIGAGLLVVRRRDDGDPPHLRALEATAPPTPRAGLHVERILAGGDLAAAPDDVLLASRLRLAGPAEPSAGVRATVPAELARLDGTRALGDVLAAGALPVVRGLLERGLVIQLS